jgi:hypothetical protein
MNGMGIDWSSILVLLVRGEIMRRFPRLIVYAAPGKIIGQPGNQALTLNDSIPWTPPEFVMPLDATTTAYAYPHTEQQVRSNLGNNNAGFYFVFSEPVTGPRFNFDATSSGPLQLCPARRSRWPNCPSRQERHGPLCHIPTVFQSPRRACPPLP